ncbi:hypothetical protein PPYR_01571 [Photinus pyralis]|uniref:Uncharacterized protein n=1 Tax=Photinus pyralis TaxID=7054 RepID=A0A5N4B4Q7_PHOPY|nr:hypothetical protein PPYR_01571 [Photinus pyralis]
MDFNKILKNINSAGMLQERKVLKIEEMEIGKLYKIKKLKSIMNHFGRGIVCELEEEDGNVSIFLPQRMVREIDDDALTILNGKDKRIGIVVHGLHNDLPKIQLVPVD